MRTRLVAVMAIAVSAASGGSPQPASPARRIIDMHLHTVPFEAATPNSPKEDYEKTWKTTKARLDKRRIVLAAVSGSSDIAETWRALAPKTLIEGVSFPCDKGMLPNSGGRRCFPDGASFPDLKWLRAEIDAGRIGFLGEVLSQYVGIAPADARLEPYFALAEELDVPVAIHMGIGPPGAIYSNGVCGPEPCAPGYRAALSNPILLEEVLVRHPKLRVWIMHAGWPLSEPMIQLLYSHPGVNVDVAALGFAAAMPHKAFEDYVCGLAKNGFGKRIMWGSDFDDFDEAIDALEAAPCLSAEQKDDIFYNNAAKFLRLPTLAGADGRSP